MDPAFRSPWPSKTTHRGVIHYTTFKGSGGTCWGSPNIELAVPDTLKLHNMRKLANRQSPEIPIKTRLSKISKPNFCEFCLPSRLPSI